MSLIMRTRNRSSQMANPNVVGQYYWPTATNGPSGIQYCKPLALAGNLSPISWNHPLVSETITDEGSTGAGPHRERYCVHEKVENDVLPIESHIGVSAQACRPKYGLPSEWCPIYFYNNSVLPSLQAYQSSGTYSTWNPTAGAGIAPLLDVLPSRQGRLASAALKRIETLHLSTTAIEARDLPETFRLFSRRGELFQNLKNLRRLRRLDAGGFAQALKSATRAYRAGQLGYSWGIMPTIRDASNISHELARSRKRILRTQFSVYESQVANKAGSKKASARAAYAGIVEVQEDLSVRRVDGCHVTWNRPTYDGSSFQQAADFIDQYVGVNPAGLIWEVLPFSFAVDWLLSVDNVIDSIFLNTSSNFIVQYWYSLKYQYVRRISYEVCSNVGGPQTGPAKYEWDRKSPIKRVVSYYLRQPLGKPSVTESLNTRGANLKNVGLLALVALGLRK